MTRDFSYLDTKYSNRHYKLIALFAFVSMMVFLIIGSKYIGTLSPMMAFGLIFTFLIGMVILIHWLGGVPPHKILSYQMWIQDEKDRLKK